MVSLKEKINNLIFKEKGVEILSTPTNGYFPDAGKDGVGEYIDFATRFMKQYKIGKYLKIDKWGSRRVKQINNLLRKIIEPKANIKHIVDGKQLPQEIKPPKNPLKIYQDLKKDIKGKDFTNYDFERVARTETARMKATFQLLRFKELGVTYVTHKTKNDDKVANICKLHSNRDFKIDYLLANEEHRIPLHVNCRCRYQLSSKE